MKGEHSSEWLSLPAYHAMQNNENSAHWPEVGWVLDVCVVGDRWIIHLVKMCNT